MHSMQYAHLPVVLEVATAAMLVWASLHCDPACLETLDDMPRGVCTFRMDRASSTGIFLKSTSCPGSELDLLWESWVVPEFSGHPSLSSVVVVSCTVPASGSPVSPACVGVRCMSLLG